MLTTRQAATLLVTVFIIAACGIVYELIIGTLSSYLLGSSVTYFSITIGLFLSAMGWGRLPRADYQLAAGLVYFCRNCRGTGRRGRGGVALRCFCHHRPVPRGYGPADFAYRWTHWYGNPLLTRLLGGWGALKDTLANVLAFDYLGALLASVLFPLVLLPELGLLKTSFAIGLLNLGVVGVNLVVFTNDCLTGGRWQPLPARSR